MQLFDISLIFDNFAISLRVNLKNYLSTNQKLTIINDEEQEKKKKVDFRIAHRIECRQKTAETEANFAAATEICKTVLHPFTRPIHGDLLMLWETGFRSLRLIQTNEFRRMTEAVELENFHAQAMSHIDGTKDKLLRNWFPEVQNVFYAYNKKSDSLQNMKSRQLCSFFESTATLLTRQLQNLALDSIYDYKNLIKHSQEPDSTFSFVIRLVIDGEQVKFEPEMSDFHQYMRSITDVIASGVNQVPRVETKLYSEKPFTSRPGDTGNLQPIILPNIVRGAKYVIDGVINEASKKPQEHLEKGTPG